MLSEIKAVKGDSEATIFRNIPLRPAEDYGAIILLTSDKGMCGQIHSAVFKYARQIVSKHGDFGKIPLITIGDRIGSLSSK